jgi:inner membrane protein
MCTVYTHSVAGLGLAYLCARRPMRWPYWVLAALLPMVPDLDAFSLAPSNSLWGHRGFTHSLVFALWLGALAASLTFRYLRASFGWLTAVFFVVTASHGLLDALTRNGEAIPFFWPSAARYGSWGPMPLPDIALELPDPRNSRALQSEMLWVWLPTAVAVGVVMAYRLWKRRGASGRRSYRPPEVSPASPP